MKIKLLRQDNRIEDYGMDQQRAAGWLCEHTLKGGKKRTQRVSQGGSLHNKVGERMKARAIIQGNCNPLYWKHQLLLLVGLGAL